MRKPLTTRGRKCGLETMYAAWNAARAHRILLGVILVFCLISLTSCAFFVPRESGRVECPTAASQQLVLVVTSSWGDSTGELQTFERSKLGSGWKAVSSVIPVDVGRNGLGWGVGLHGETHEGGSTKVEGDEKSPAGVFSISEVFGFAGRDSASLFKMPYAPLSSVSQCVDDARSEYYNLLVDSTDVSNARWKSNETMRSPDSLYRWGAFVDHNVSPRIPGRGSCIFLHVWEGPGRPTVGCTAMDASELLKILRWLDAVKRPVLVQLPIQEYDTLWRMWKLPSPTEFKFGSHEAM